MSAEEAHDDVGAGRQPSAAICIGTIQMPRSEDDSCAEPEAGCKHGDLLARMDEIERKQRQVIRAIAQNQGHLVKELLQLAGD